VHSLPKHLTDTFLELFYQNFFDPPPGSPSSRIKTTRKKKHFPDSSGSVRFHDEVKVLKIKARGKNLPVTTVEDEVSDDDDDNHEEEDDGDSSDAFVGQGN
jgi:U3 small nucleolar RNA-associated protein MPP10